MMSDYQKQADILSRSLKLPLAPVAIAFCNEVPAAIPAFEGHVAAGCEFWELASQKAFVTSARDHQLCSIGVYTHNISGAPKTQDTELNTTLKAMMGLDYVRAIEIPEIPVNSQASEFVIYGPLQAFPTTADVVVLFANAQQGLVISEAVSRVDGATPLAMGRPACAAVPQVMNTGVATLSLGCCGARTYVEALTDSTSLWVLPVSKLQQYAEQIQVLAAANSALTQYHQQRKRDVQAGENPTVATSLERM